MRRPPATSQRDIDAQDLTMLALAAERTPRTTIAAALRLDRRTIKRRLATLAADDIAHDPTAKEHYTWHSPD